MTSITNSQILDTSNNVIAKVGSEKINEPISFSKMPNNLKNAYVSIEDQRFYKHHGIDIKRTTHAIFSYVIHFGSSSFGGSSITQQLVKNMTGDDSNTVTRKITEWVKALSLETCMSKNEILGMYLNIIYVGPNVYGVEAGSKYYFNKSTSELSLAECAYIAGINHSPNSYNPFSGTNKSDKIKKRTTTVLNKMLELNYINQDEYNKALSEVQDGLNFKQGNDVVASGNGVYSYHTDALLSELIDTISKRKNISSSFATNYLNMAGLTIHSTQNSNIQSQMENEFEKKKYILQSVNDSSKTSQAAMVIIDHTNGNIVGCIGGLGKKDTARSFNRATQAARQTGSAIKPIAILAPALKEKIVTPVTQYDDSPTTFDDGTEEGYSPVDYDPYLGTITLRRAVESSQNIPFVKMMEQLTPEKSVKFLHKLGITTLTENDTELPLALGGLDIGMTPLETAAAYATIANDGVYIEPTFYTKVESSNGETFFKSKQKTRKVFSKSVAYVLKELLTQPVKGNSGTATYCSISGIDVAAKTGTTNENYDRWLCGFTPYYTAATWYGFDLNETINFSGKNPAGLLWAHVMNNIHSGLKDASFEMPSGVSTATICADSGKLANSGCPNRYTEYFLKGTLPDKCTLHSGSSNNVQSNKNTTTETKGLYDEDVPEPEPPKSNTSTQKNNTSQNGINTNKNSINTNTNTNTGNSSNTNKNTATNSSNSTNSNTSNSTTSNTLNNTNE